MREETDVRSMLTIVNDIFEQVGMSFYIDSLIVTNIADACRALYDGPSEEGHWSFDDVAHILPDADGLKCYFIDLFHDSQDARAAHGSNGILLTKQADARSWAHEIGHSCGLDDIYDEHNGVSIQADEAFEWRHAMDDWNNGSSGISTKGSRYYRRGLTRLELIGRLLMYGYGSTNKVDISTGCVDGVLNMTSSTSCLGPVTTGILATGCMRSPVHRRKHNSGGEL